MDEESHEAIESVLVSTFNVVMKRGIPLTVELLRPNASLQIFHHMLEGVQKHTTLVQATLLNLIAHDLRRQSPQCVV